MKKIFVLILYDISSNKPLVDRCVLHHSNADADDPKVQRAEPFLGPCSYTNYMCSLLCIANCTDVCYCMSVNLLLSSVFF